MDKDEIAHSSQSDLNVSGSLLDSPAIPPRPVSSSPKQVNGSSPLSSLEDPAIQVQADVHSIYVIDPILCQDATPTDDVIFHSLDHTDLEEVSTRETIHVDTTLHTIPILQLNSETLSIPSTPELLLPPLLPPRPASRSSIHSKSSTSQPDHYRLKPIFHQDMHLNIITQNANGPCPLISLCNVLILHGCIAIAPNATRVSFDELLELLFEYIVTRESELDWDGTKGCLEKMQSGMDVNVDFSGGFEQSEEVALFKSFGVDLTHGWLVDPHDFESVRVLISRCGGYNRAMELCVEAREVEMRESQPDVPATQDDADIVLDALIVQQYLDNNASQLSVYGLLTLNNFMQDNDLAVLFRNNHFATLTKRNGLLYTLVTDQGYLSNDDAVWETLDSVDGDSEYVDSAFRSKSMQRAVSEQDMLTEEQDRLMAQSLQVEEEYWRDRGRLVMPQQGSQYVSQESVVDSRASSKRKGLCAVM